MVCASLNLSVWVIKSFIIVRSIVAIVVTVACMNV